MLGPIGPAVYMTGVSLLSAISLLVLAPMVQRRRKRLDELELKQLLQLSSALDAALRDPDPELDRSSTPMVRPGNKAADKMSTSTGDDGKNSGEMGSDLDFSVHSTTPLALYSSTSSGGASGFVPSKGDPSKLMNNRSSPPSSNQPNPPKPFNPMKHTAVVNESLGRQEARRLAALSGTVTGGGGGSSSPPSGVALPRNASVASNATATAVAAASRYMSNKSNVIGSKSKGTQNNNNNNNNSGGSVSADFSSANATAAVDPPNPISSTSTSRSAIVSTGIGKDTRDGQTKSISKVNIAYIR